jgi:8-oxo-dGTP pyrophosphatase MutT (NUDIX family)
MSAETRQMDGRDPEIDTPIRPAATVIVVRDGVDGLETLLLRRHSDIAFHGGAWVFPGGRLDEADYAGVAVPEDPRDDGHSDAARLAAVREAAEEAGLELDPAAMAPFSHWTTPAVRVKRYATWFFIVPAPTGEVTVDGGEITDHRWMSPSAALAACDAGEIELPPPTYVSLLRIARSGTVDEAIAEATAAPYLRFEPHIRLVDGGFASVYEGDVAYDDEELFDAPGPRHRLYAVTGAWRYERS